MWLRTWTTRVRAGRDDDYLLCAQQESRAMFLEQPGCAGVLFLRLGDGRHAVCSIWADVDALLAVEHSPSYQRTVRALTALDVLTGTPEMTAEEVEGGAVDVGAFARALPASVQLLPRQPSPGPHDATSRDATVHDRTRADEAVVQDSIPRQR